MTNNINQKEAEVLIYFRAKTTNLEELQRIVDHHLDYMIDMESNEDLISEVWDACAVDITDASTDEVITPSIGTERDLLRYLSKRFIAWKLWANEDIGKILVENGYEPSEENIRAVASMGCLTELSECTDEEWAIIEQAVAMAESRNALK